jgi:protein-L-isoaspartate(D-aspartate) O-methyltransferase
MGASAFPDDELKVVRRAFARQMLALADAASNAPLERAFASVERERFLGTDPWLISHGIGYRAIPTNDPVVVYQDILFALAADRGANNGSPSLHARWLHASGVRPGERVAHLGAGAGYYTAILSALVGPDGRVDAIEVDPALAADAARALESAGGVTVRAGDALQSFGGDYDVVYVNFAVARPPAHWAKALRRGGRLIFPLGVPEPTQGRPGVRHTSLGAGLMVERREAGLAVRWLGRAYFVFAEGAVVADAERDALRGAFQRGGVEFVRGLHFDAAGPPGRDWHAGEGWRLSYDEVPA